MLFRSDQQKRKGNRRSSQQRGDGGCAARGPAAGAPGFRPAEAQRQPAQQPTAWRWGVRSKRSGGGGGGQPTSRSAAVTGAAAKGAAAAAPRVVLPGTSPSSCRISNLAGCCFAAGLVGGVWGVSHAAHAMVVCLGSVWVCVWPRGRGAGITVNNDSLKCIIGNHIRKWNPGGPKTQRERFRAISPGPGH